MRLPAVLLCLAVCAPAQELREVRRICVEELSGDRSAAQIRDMIIAALQKTGAFLLTEKPERADAVLKGSAEDLVFTDTFQTEDSLTARTNTGSSRRVPGISLGEHESQRIVERKHEATASVRLVNKDGDVLWSTTQESQGAKFRSASADVAERIAKQLLVDVRGTAASK